MTPPDLSLAHPVLSQVDPISAYEKNLPHILIMLDQFPKSLGGGERIALRLAALLPAYGFRATILTFSIHPESAVWTITPPCPIYLLPLQKTYDLTAIRAARSLGRFLKRHEVRLVETFFESADLWGGTVVRLLSSARLVWSRRDMGILRGRKHRIAYRLFSFMPHRVFAVSEKVRLHAIETDHVHPSKVQVVYNGLDLALQIPVGAAPGQHQEAFRIVTVGNIRRVKGHDLLLTAAASVLERFPAATFWVAGEILEPEYFAELQEQLSRSGLASRFHFVHGVHEIDKFLQNADLFVLPSRSEGFSNAILEAMACALPVVATDVGGNAEAVEHQRAGLIVPAESAAGLAAAIIQLLDEPARRKTMGEAGRQRIVNLFTTQAMMHTVSKAFRDLLERP